MRRWVPTCFDHIYPHNSFQIYPPLTFPIHTTLYHMWGGGGFPSRPVCVAQNILRCMVFHWSMDTLANRPLSSQQLTNANRSHSLRWNWMSKCLLCADIRTGLERLFLHYYVLALCTDETTMRKHNLWLSNNPPLTSHRLTVA